MKFRSFLLIALLVFTAAPAQAGLLEFLFPTLRDRGPDPSETLQAPFAYDPANPVQGKVALPLPEDIVPLAQPHKNPAELAKWLMVTVSELLTLDTGFETAITQDAGYFSENGLQQYRDFLNQNNIAKTLQSGNFQVNSVVTDVPVMLNEGVVQGRYRWLFEVPVMITYMDRNTHSYKKAKQNTQKLSLVIQVGRMEKTTPTQSVLIERWTGKKRLPGQN